MLSSKIKIKRNIAPKYEGYNGRSNFRAFYDMFFILPISIAVSCVILFSAALGVPLALKATKESVRAMLPGFYQTSESKELSDISGVHFSDLSSTSKYFDAVAHLKVRGVIKGYEDGTFRPTENISRAELISMVVRLKNYYPLQMNYRNCFSDVSDQWFATAVCFAKEKSWVSGYEKNDFSPFEPLRKAEAIKIILNAFEINLIKDHKVSGYMDVMEDKWYYDYIMTALQRGLLSESPLVELFEPEEYLSRADAAQLIYRANLL